MGFFRVNHGIIPACDVATLDDMKRIIYATDSVNGVVAYKCGRMLQSRCNIEVMAKTVSNYTDLPMIFDPQKAANDTEYTEPNFIREYAKHGVKTLIIFPHSSPRVQAVCTKATYDNDILPIGGFRLTQKGFDETEPVRLDDIFPELGDREFRGYIAEDAEDRALELYALTGVKHFIGPANETERLRHMKEVLQSHGVRPVFCMPGIGKQGGNITSAFEVVNDCPCAYAIIGSSIYSAPDMSEAAKRFAGEALEFE